MPGPNDDPTYPKYKVTFKKASGAAAGDPIGGAVNLGGPHTSVALSIGGRNVRLALSRNDADEGFPNLTVTLVEE
jgi:hypothetical protein